MSRPAVRTRGSEAANDDTRARIARDLLLLADLHDHEPDRGAIVALWARCYDGLLEAKPYGATLRDAVNHFCDSLTEIPTCFDAKAGDALLADFRRIRVMGDKQSQAHRTTAYELDAEHLRVEAAAVRQWAAARGIADEPQLWADGDGVAAELRHLAYLVAADGMAAPIDKLAKYLERYLLRSVDGFAAEVAAHSGTHFYQELGILTTAYVHELSQRFDSGVLDRQRSTNRRQRMAKAPALRPHGGLRHPSGATEAL